MFEQLPPELRSNKRVDQRPIEDQLTDIEERLCEISDEIEELESEQSRLESKQSKLEKQIDADEAAKQRLAENRQAEADERCQRELLKKRYGHPFVRSIADFWQPKE